MKNIEDVIKAYECKKSIEDECNECPYITECDDKYHCECEARDNDTLHYLKEYRDLKSTMDWHAQMEEIRDIIENVPLTWAELKTMEGKPVWVEEIGIKYATPHWAVHYGIMDGYDGDENLYLQPFEVLTKYTLGKTWQAYRKERNER